MFFLHVKNIERNTAKGLGAGCGGVSHPRLSSRTVANNSPIPTACLAVSNEIRAIFHCTPFFFLIECSRWKLPSTKGGGGGAGASNIRILCHEDQESKLCAVHCVNTVLQGPFFSEFDLAALASDLDRSERQIDVQLRHRRFRR